MSPSLATRLAGPAPERLPRHPHRLSREDVARSQRGRILRAVAESVAAKGYADTSVADVIARAGVSRSTFYELYDGKESAFLDAYAGIELVHQQLLESFRAGEAPVGMVRGAVRAHLAGLAAEPAFTWMFFVEAVAAGPRILARRREATEGFLDVLTTMVELARQWDPDVPAADRSLLLAFVGAVRELVATHLMTESARSLPELEDAVVAVAERLLLGLFRGTGTSERTTRKGVSRSRVVAPKAFMSDGNPPSDAGHGDPNDPHRPQAGSARCGARRQTVA